MLNRCRLLNKNKLKVLFLILLLVATFFIINYVRTSLEYKSVNHHIYFKDLSNNFYFSTINLEVVHEYPNEDYHNFIKIDFDIKKKNIETSFYIIINKSLGIDIQKSSSKDITIKLVDTFSLTKKYKISFNRGVRKTKIALFFRGDVFSGNSFNKLFSILLEFDKKQIYKVKPILGAITDAKITTTLNDFIIQNDSLHYKVGKVKEVDKSYSMYFRFTDLKKQAEFQTLSILLSTLLGVILSFIVTILLNMFKLLNPENNSTNKIYKG